MVVRRRPRVLVVVAAMAGGVGPVTGSRAALAQETVGPSVPEARRHFESGRALYSHGAYREALAELQAAHALDPSAKDLVFNLGVVEEKLGEIDEALRWFHTYTTMPLTPPERERADAYVRRLEGARRELEPPPPPSSEAGGPSPPPTTPAETEPPASSPTPAHGRLDAATIAAGSVAGAALVFGVVLGVKATIDRPAHFVTGVDGSYSDLVDRVHMAHEEAVAADIGFGIAVAAGVAATVLYLTRTHQASDPSSARKLPSAFVSAMPLTGGGGLFVQGSL
jgi:tetratricopeptide repeat protein